MMDNEALVDQIVRSLSFEVVAMPQNVLQIDSTSKSTPLNVKIRVRKKHDAGLRHGVLSMPKVDTKSHSGKDNATQRVRLVSSDQTVMSFNVLMDAEFDEIPTNLDKQKLNTVTPVSGVGINNDKDNRAELSKNTNKYNFSPVSKRNKDIFGRCKPGGCLDPPFGEDKYSYQPTKQDLSLPIKDDAIKLRSSSIFKNKIFQRKKKSSQDVEPNKSEPKTTTEDDSILSLYETGSNAAYSNSIITYPHSSNSGEMTAVEEKPNRKKYSSEDKSRSSVSEDTGSYYILPKKIRNKSNQSDLKIAKLNDEIVERNFNNVNQITTEIDHFEKKLSDKDEVKQTSNFVPIPLLVPLNAILKDPSNTESITSQQKENALVLDTENKSDETVSILPKIKQLNCPVDETDFSKNEKTIDTEKKSHLVAFEDVEKIDIPELVVSQKMAFEDVEKIDIPELVVSQKMAFEDVEKIDIPELIVSQKTQDFENNPVDIIPSRLSTATENSESNIKKYDSDYLDLNHGDQIDNESHPLVSTKQRSILDIAANFSSLRNVTETANNVVEVSKNIDTVSYSTDDLAHLWKNKNEPLKSMPDFITHDTLSGINTEGEYKASPIEPQPLPLETLSYNTELNQQDLEFENNLVQPTAEVFEDSMREKKGKILDAVPVLESVTNIMNLSDSHNNIIDNKEMSENNMMENSEKLFLVNAHNRNDENSPIFFNGKDVDENSTNNEIHDQTQGKSKFFTGNNVDESFLPKNKINDSEDGKLLVKKSSTDTLKSVTTKQENIYDDSNDNKNTFDSYNVFKNASMTKLTKEEIISKDFNELKNEESIMEGESEKNEAVTGTLNSQDEKYLSCSNLDIVADNGKLEILFNKNEIMIEHNNKNLSNIVQLTQSQHKINGDLGKPNLGQILTNINAESEHKIVPNKTLQNQNQKHLQNLQKNAALWKIDIGLQSYTDENNDRVIKSFDNQNTPERHLNDTILVAQCYLKSKSNEIKIPIDELNDLSIKIRSNTALDLSKDLRKDVTDDQSNKKKKIILSIPNEKDFAKDKDANKSEANTLNKAISDDIRDALNRIYEQELLPLQEIIKGLREEIDMLVACQNKFKEKVQKLHPKPSRPLKLMYPVKKCACIRKI